MRLQQHQKLYMPSSEIRQDSSDRDTSLVATQINPVSSTHTLCKPRLFAPERRGGGGGMQGHDLSEAEDQSRRERSPT